MIRETPTMPRIWWSRHMSSATLPKVVTPEELLAMPDSDSYELVDGELVEREMGARSVYVGGRLGRLLGNYVEETHAGWVFPADAGYQCFSARPTLVRKPDVSFIRVGRLP